MKAGAIRIRGLTKRYGAFTAVDNVDLDVEPGALMALLGPSGCGKTTTLRMIAGFIKLDAGTISVDGDLLSDASTVRPPERRNMGMVFQSYAVWPHMTVADNIAYGLKMRGVGRAQTRARVDKILDVVGLRGQEAKYPGALSGGQQQRVALARAVIVEPRILLLDEPLSNLDAKLRESMRHELRRIQQSLGITAVFVTHSQEEALSMADHIAVMRDGRVIERGTPQSLYSAPATRFVADFVGLANFLEGDVVGRAGDRVRIETPTGTVEAVWGGGSEKQAQVLIRPEHLELHSPDSLPVPGKNSLEARIVEATFSGSVVDYLVDAGDESRLRVQAFAPQRYHAGQPVRLCFSPEYARTVS